MTEKAKELINLLYADNLTEFGKIQLADLIEKQQNRIDELEKALIEEQLKHTDEIKQLNKGINTLITKRKKWKNRYYKRKAKLYKLKKEGI